MVAVVGTIGFAPPFLRGIFATSDSCTAIWENWNIKHTRLWNCANSNETEKVPLSFFLEYFYIDAIKIKKGRKLSNVNKIKGRVPSHCQKPSALFCCLLTFKFLLFLLANSISNSVSVLHSIKKLHTLCGIMKHYCSSDFLLQDWK